MEAEVERLKAKVSEAKEINITKVKESDAYKSKLNHTITLFLTNERIKMKKLL